MDKIKKVESFGHVQPRLTQLHFQMATPFFIHLDEANFLDLPLSFLIG